MNTTIAFWDSSALNPLFVDEPTSPWAMSLARRFSPAVWWATPVEIHSAIARVRRAGGLDDSATQLALRRVHAMHRDWHEVSPSDEARDMAVAVLDRYPLRAADSLQLAAALIWCRSRPAGTEFYLCR